MWLKILHWLPLVQRVCKDIDDAGKDGDITVAEAIDIAADSAKAWATSNGLIDKPMRDIGVPRFVKTERKRMGMAAALAAVALAWPAFACTTPATGTLEDLMAQAAWTTQTGSDFADRRAQINISLPALAGAGFGCLRWSVELVAPVGVTVAQDSEGNAGALSYSDLAATASVKFDIRVAHRLHNDEVRYEQAWLKVRVRNPLADAGVYLARQGGSPLWLYPVLVRFS